MMKRAGLFRAGKFLAACLCLMLALDVAHAAADGRRVALVIGNSAYQDGKLNNPANDGEDITGMLRTLGFEVISRRDADQKQMKAAVREFGQKLRGAETGLFYFAGHGIQIKNINYLIPVGADIQSEADTEDQAVSLDYVMRTLEEGGARFNIAILDACRNNPYARSFRSASRGLAVTQAAGGMLIAYATAPGSVAADGKERNGTYTKHLLKNLNEGDSDIQKVFQRVRTGVVAETGGKQTPWETTSLTGDFYFKPGGGTQIASLVPVPAPAQPAARAKTKEGIEDDTWSEAEGANTIEAINAYLSGYPKGRYAAQAKVKLATLKKQAQQPAPAATPAGREDNETALWTEAQKGNSKDDYDAYLSQYPKGKYIALAKSRIKKLQDDAQAAAEQQEQQAWQAAQDENSEASYTRYLKGYPNGRYAGLAKARQEKLKNDVAAKEEAELWNKAESGNDKSAVEAYLNKHPSGRYVAAASEKLKAIREEEAKGPAMVRIPGKNYEMGKYHVTRGEFAKFASETGYDAGNSCYVWGGAKWDNRSGSNWRNPGFTQDDNHPVACVNWHDAQAYASWLSKKTGRQYRLPVESEWEYACYGGSQTEYCGGGNIDAVAWYDGNSNKTTHPVGQKQANGYGLYDMSGNLWHWMENKYDNEHDWRAIRGGSWFNVPQYVRAASRSGGEPAKRSNLIGFRLARTLP